MCGMQRLGASERAWLVEEALGGRRVGLLKWDAAEPKV